MRQSYDWERMFEFIKAEDACAAELRAETPEMSSGKQERLKRWEKEDTAGRLSRLSEQAGRSSASGSRDQIERPSVDRPNNQFTLQGIAGELITRLNNNFNPTSESRGDISPLNNLYRTRMGGRLLRFGGR